MKKALMFLFVLMLCMPAVLAECSERRYDNGVYAQKVRLCDLDWFSKDRFHLDPGGVNKDNYGNYYDNEMYAVEGSIDYFLGGQYAELSGTLFVHNRATNTGYSIYGQLWDTVTFNVYLDDQLIYSRKGLDVRFKPEPLLFNVRGAQFLRIEFLNNCYIDTGMDRVLAMFGNAELTPL